MSTLYGATDDLFEFNTLRASAGLL